MEGSTTQNLSLGLIPFSKAKGLLAGISREGEAITAGDGMNTSHYKAPTKTVDIVVRRSVTNSKADPLLGVAKNVPKADYSDSK